MTCYRPIAAYKAPGGGVAFDSTKGYGDLPLELPCGRCIGCKIQRSREWALRAVHEAQLHDRNSFLTLTYADEHLPNNISLDIKAWQLFAKRLRKKIGPFRFLASGEYSDDDLRPHYHVCLFGHNFREDRIFLEDKDGYPRYWSPTVTDTWGKGHCTISELTYTSAHYVAKYALKKITGKKADDHYTRVNPTTGEVHRVRPEFLTMSRGGRTGQGGLGSQWLQKYKNDVYPDDHIVHEGKKFRPPRFYDNQLPEEELSTLKHIRRRKIQTASEDLTPERLRTREFVTEHELNRFKRKL